LYGDPWVAFNKSFIIPESLDFFGPVRFYVQYSGTYWTENWQWSVSYQNGWINENKPPYVDSLDLNGSPIYCEVGPGEGRFGLRWNYQDDEGDRQNQYQLQIAVDSSFSKESLIIDDYSSVVRGDPAGSTNTSPSIMIKRNPNLDLDKFEVGYNAKYWWRVRVKDENGMWSQWKRGLEITTPSHPYPWPDFTWNSEKTAGGKRFSFKDNSSLCFKDDGSEYFCRDIKSEIKYEWDFNYIPLEGFTTDSNEINPERTYREVGGYIVRMRIVDKEIGSCYTSRNITVEEEDIHPPGWKPTASVGLLIPAPLESFLSQVSAIFFKK